MKVLIVDCEEGDWRRIYADGKLVMEGHPPLPVPLDRALGLLGIEVVREVVAEFDMINDE